MLNLWYPHNWWCKFSFVTPAICDINPVGDASLIADTNLICYCGLIHDISLICGIILICDTSLICHTSVIIDASLMCDSGFICDIVNSHQVWIHIMCEFTFGVNSHQVWIHTMCESTPVWTQTKCELWLHSRCEFTPGVNCKFAFIEGTLALWNSLHLRNAHWRRASFALFACFYGTLI